MKKIDDLSFSGLTELIQKDTKKAGNAIVSLALEADALDEKIGEVQRYLNSLKNRKDSISFGVQRILQMIDKKSVIVKRRDYIVVAKHNIACDTTTLYIDHDVI